VIRKVAKDRAGDTAIRRKKDSQVLFCSCPWIAVAVLPLPTTVSMVTVVGWPQPRFDASQEFVKGRYVVKRAMGVAMISLRRNATAIAQYGQVWGVNERGYEVCMYVSMYARIILIIYNNNRDDKDRRRQRDMGVAVTASHV